MAGWTKPLPYATARDSLRQRCTLGARTGELAPAQPLAPATPLGVRGGVGRVLRENETFAHSSLRQESGWRGPHIFPALLLLSILGTPRANAKGHQRLGLQQLPPGQPSSPLLRKS